MKWALVFPAMCIAGGLLLLKGGNLPEPSGDVLSASYAADRATQVAVLRDLAAQKLDGKTDDGRRKSAEFFNANRFKNRAADFEVYTNAIAEAIAENRVKEFADSLEAK